MLFRLEHSRYIPQSPDGGGFGAGGLGDGGFGAGGFGDEGSKHSHTLMKKSCVTSFLQFCTASIPSSSYPIQVMDCPGNNLHHHNHSPKCS